VPLTVPTQVNDDPLDIGRHTGGVTEYLNGKLDDIRVYNRALSVIEIKMLYLRETPGPCGGPAEASVYGTDSACGPPGLFKHLAYLLLPVGVVIVLTIWRRKK